MLRAATYGGIYDRCLSWRLWRRFTSIPVVDVGSLVDDSATHEQRSRVGRDLHDACLNVGFFYVAGHCIPRELVEGVRSDARAWFAQPDDVKARIALGPEAHYRGYQAVGANVTRYDGKFQRDWHEAIDLYYEATRIRASPLHGQNRWPVDSPAFTSTLKAYAAAMDALGGAIMRGVALGLGVPADTFERAHCGDPYWCMRVIHYPPLPASNSETSCDGAPCRSERCSGLQAPQASALAGAEVSRAVRLSCGEHSDYGMLTMVNQDDDIAALQVKNADGAWITAEPVPDTFVCNIGDMMRVWTNGLYTPTLHRVINPEPRKSRISVPFFHEPGFDTIVRPMLGLHGSSLPPRLAPRHYGEHLERKVLSNFEL